MVFPWLERHLATMQRNKILRTMGKPVQARFHLYPKSCTVDRMISKGSQKTHTFIAVEGLFFFGNSLLSPKSMGWMGGFTNLKTPPTTRKRSIVIGDIDY